MGRTKITTDDDDLPEVDFDGRVHQVHSFTCGGFGCIATIRAAPERAIAGRLLEDIGDWITALNTIRRENIPAGVANAINLAYEAASGWVEWLDRQPTDDKPPRRPKPGPNAA